IGSCKCCQWFYQVTDNLGTQRYPRRTRRSLSPPPCSKPTGGPSFFQRSLADSRTRATLAVVHSGSVRTSPYLRLVGYYALLAVGAWLVIRFFPAVPQLLDHVREMSALGIVTARRGRDLEQVVGPTAQTLSQGEWALVTLLSMTTALLLVLPVAWVYMLTKQRSGYDQSVVQTVIILPMTVASTVILVQNSLALAFTLAAIVAAVRFRNTLKDTKDAVYIFLALAVGVAAGVFAPAVAAVMSVMFNAVVLLLWKSNVGNIYADQRVRTPPLAPAEALLGPRRHDTKELLVGNPQPHASLPPRDTTAIADHAANLCASVLARSGDKKEDRFNGVLLVHTTQPEAAQRFVEGLLDVQARRSRLAEI